MTWALCCITFWTTACNGVKYSYGSLQVKHELLRKEQKHEDHPDLKAANAKRYLSN